MKQNYWKSISITFLISIAFALFGCQKGAIDGKSEETSTSNTDAQEIHVAEETLTEHQQAEHNQETNLMAHLTGVVLDDLGMPIEGATVSAFGKTDTTGLGGTWALQDIPVSSVLVHQALIANGADDQVITNQVAATIPVSIVADGHTSAVVYVGTTAILSDTNQALTNTGDALTIQQGVNTVVISGLAGTSGDVALKRMTSSVSGYLRNAKNGTLADKITLTLVPTRNTNDKNAGFATDDNLIGALNAKTAGTVVYGYKPQTVTTTSNGMFQVENIPNATEFAIQINSAGVEAVNPPAGNDIPGDAGSKNDLIGTWTVNVLSIDENEFTLDEPVQYGQEVTLNKALLDGDDNVLYAAGKKFYVAEANAGKNTVKLGHKVTDNNGTVIEALTETIKDNTKFDGIISWPVTIPGTAVNEDPTGDSEDVAKLADKNLDHWLVTVNHDETKNLGNLWIKEITSYDNINPYVSEIPNSFESDFENAGNWVQLDDVVKFGVGGEPLVIKFSEPLDNTRFSFDGQDTGAAVSVLIFERESQYIGPTWTQCAFVARDRASNVNCEDKRIMIDAEKSSLVGDTLTIYTTSTPIGGNYIDVLLKRTDFRDMSDDPNYLSTPPVNGILPDLVGAINEVGQFVDVTDIPVANSFSYRNYWQYRFMMYKEPNLTPKIALNRPDLQQVTCKDVIATENGNADTTRPYDNNVKDNNQDTGWKEHFNTLRNFFGWADINDVVTETVQNKEAIRNGSDIFTNEALNAAISGLCDYDNKGDLAGTTHPFGGESVAEAYDAANIFQLNDDLPNQLDVDGTVTTASRLEVLAKLMGKKDAEEGKQQNRYPSWNVSDPNANGGKVVNDVAIVRIKGDVQDGATYKVTAFKRNNTNTENETVTLSKIPGLDQLAVITDKFGNPDAELYLGLAGDTEADGFLMKGKDKGQLLWLNGVRPGYRILIVPVKNKDGEGIDHFTDQSDGGDNNPIVLDDLTPPMVAVQSNNYVDKAYQTSGGAGGVDEVPGETLIKEKDPSVWFPGLRLTASLFDYSSRRGSRNSADNLGTPLLFIDNQDWPLVVSGRSYTEGQYNNWLNHRNRDILIEMTEELESPLKFKGGAFDIDEFKKYDGTWNELGNDGNEKTDNDGNPIEDDNNNVSRDGSLAAELSGLSSYSAGPYANAMLVATLGDWRNVGNRSLMEIKGLRDRNENEIVKEDTGVIFLDRTPPMAVKTAIYNSNDNDVRLITQGAIDLSTSDELTEALKKIKGKLYFDINDLTAAIQEAADNDTLIPPDNVVDESEKNDVNDNVAVVVRFDQVIGNLNKGQALEILSSDKTYKIIFDYLDDGSANHTISGVDFWDAKGRDIGSGTKVPVDVFGLGSKTLAFVLDGNVDNLVTVDKVSKKKVNMENYFAALGNDPVITWPGLGDTVGEVEGGNNWKSITDTAKTTDLLELKNDAYYCKDGECFAPGIVSHDNIGPTLKYKADLQKACWGWNIQSDEEDEDDTRYDYTCIATDDNNWSKEDDKGVTIESEKASLSLHLLHTTIGTVKQINHAGQPDGYDKLTDVDPAEADGENNEGRKYYLTCGQDFAASDIKEDVTDCSKVIDDLAETYTNRNRDGIWSAFDSGADLVIYEDNNYVSKNSEESNRGAEPYEIELSFREPIKCQYEDDGKWKDVIVVGDVCENIDLKVQNGVALLSEEKTAVVGLQDVGDGNGEFGDDGNLISNIKPYTVPVATYQDPETIHINFTLRSDEKASVGDTLVIENIEDNSGNSIDITIELLDNDRGVKISPASLAY